MVNLLEARVGEADLNDDANYSLMKGYILGVMKGTSLPHPSLPTCKEHRVCASNCRDVD